MRLKFFYIILSFLFAVIIVVSSLIVLFLENERIMLQDQRLGAIASTLIASGLSLDLIENLESTDDLIHDLLGEEKIDQIINIYSLDGKILAQNYTAVEIPLKFEDREQWQTYKVSDRRVRVLNLRRGNIIVQVGVMLSAVMDLQNLVNLRLLFFVGLIFFILISTAYFGATVLFNPLKKLTLEFENMAQQLNRNLGQPLGEFVIGPELAKIGNVQGNSKLGRAYGPDEFQQLCQSIETFLKSLAGYTRSFNAQSAILTHELKTPLAVIRNSVELLKNNQQPEAIETRKGIIHKLLKDIDEMAQLINNFLQWSVLTSNPGQTDLFALYPRKILEKIVLELKQNPLYRERLRVEIDSGRESKEQEVIFSHPSHLQQLMLNIIINALTYSKADEIVRIHLLGSIFRVEDRGPGIPNEVLAELGRPFNRGPVSSNEGRSSGLGLAWVHALCQRYHWQFNFDTNSKGTLVEINFSTS